MNKRAERKFGNIGKRLLTMDWSDDQYTILTNVKDNTVSHEHNLAHHVLPAPNVPEFVRRILNEKTD